MESNNNMPMPNQPNTTENNDDVSANISSPLSGDAGSSEPASSESNLNIPSHDGAEEKAKVITPEDEVESEVIPPAILKRGIEVRAVRKGFYRQHRKRPGDTFKIAGEEEFGEWFVCTDKRMEKRRQAFLEEKRLKQQEEKARRK